MARTKQRGNGDGSIYPRGKSGRLWMAWTDEHGERQWRACRTTDRRYAERLLDVEVDRVQKIHSGPIDPSAERLVEAGQRTIEETAKAFGAMM